MELIININKFRSKEEVRKSNRLTIKSNFIRPTSNVLIFLNIKKINISTITKTNLNNLN